MSAHLALYDKHLEFLGQRLKKYRKSLALTQIELAKECIHEAKKHPKCMVNFEDRIGRLERYGNPNTGAHQLQPGELDVYAGVTSLSPDALLGLEPETTTYGLEPITRDTDRERVRLEGRRSLRTASALWSWATCLHSALVTREFMEAHHTAMFKGNAEAIAAANDMARDRSALVRHNPTKRRWAFVHYMFVDDLEMIARGENVFGDINHAVRRRLFDDLICVLNKPWNISLVVADTAQSTAVEEMSRLLRVYNSVQIAGDSLLTLQTDDFTHRCSNRVHQVLRWQGVLKELDQEATYRTRTQTLSLLQRLKRSIPSV